jgi:uncharacterized membrane protein
LTAPLRAAAVLLVAALFAPAARPAQPGGGRVLVIEANDRAGEHRRLIDGLRKSRLRVDAQIASELPADAAGLARVLNDCDAVILANVPAEQLSDAQQEAIRRHTHDAGGGLLMIGGPDSFGPGGYAGTPVEQALPVRCDPGSGAPAPGGLVLMLAAPRLPEADRWQREFAKRALRALAPGDRFGVVCWDQGPQWAVPFAPVGADREAVARKIDLISPRDMPGGNAALEAAFKALTDPARDLVARRVIFLSDRDARDVAPVLLKRLRDAGVTCTTVGVAAAGPAPGPALQHLADVAGGRHYAVADPGKLPAVATREARGLGAVWVKRDAFAPVATGAAGGDLRLPGPLPSLYGCVRTTPKDSPLVEVLLTAPPEGGRAVPVLARWRYGLGWAAAFTSDARTRLGPDSATGWDRDWAMSEVGAVFWERLVGSLLRRAAPPAGGAAAPPRPRQPDPWAVTGSRLPAGNRAAPGLLLLIDQSAHMAAVDGGTRRLDRAKRAAREVLEAAPAGTFAAVGAFSREARLLHVFTNDHRLLLRAIDAIEPTQQPGSLDDAVGLAQAFAEPGPGLAVHLFTDGASAVGPEVKLGKLDLHFHAVGPKPGAVNNVGLVTFSARRDDDNPRLAQVLAGVANFGPKPVEVRVELELASGGGGRLDFHPVQEKRATLPPRPAGGPPPEKAPAKPGAAGPPNRLSEVTVTFDLTDVPPETVLHARLLNTGDGFGLDDEAWLVLPAAHKAQLLSVGPQSIFLKAFFDAVAPDGAEVTRLPEAGEGRDRVLKQAREGAFDLIVFNKTPPASLGELPAANTLVFGAPLPPEKKPGEKVEAPAVKGWTQGHRLTRDLGKAQADFRVRQAFRLPPLPKGATALLEGENNLVLAAAVPRGRFTDVVFAFDLEDTDWPVLTSFPVFLTNALGVLGDGPELIGGRTGEPVRIPLAPSETEVRVMAPGGSTHRLRRGEGPAVLFREADRVGVYRVEAAGRPDRHFAVNLLDSGESDLAPRRSLKFADRTVEAEPARSPSAPR